MLRKASVHALAFLVPPPTKPQPSCFRCFSQKLRLGRGDFPCYRHPDPTGAEKKNSRCFCTPPRFREGQPEKAYALFHAAATGTCLARPSWWCSASKYSGLSRQTSAVQGDWQIYKAKAGTGLTRPVNLLHSCLQSQRISASQFHNKPAS